MNMSYGIPTVGYFSPRDNAGINRYTEASLIEGDYYKELQYWLSVYNRAQQFGMPNTSIAEISAQIFRVSQKLTVLRQLIKPAAENLVKNNNDDNKKIVDLFSDQGAG
jgi:myosin-crossreactive antigen